MEALILTGWKYTDYAVAEALVPCYFKCFQERAHILGIDDFRRLIREHKELNTALQPQAQVRLPDNLEGATRLHIRRVCDKCIGNITKAANTLGVSRNTVRKLPGVRYCPT
ncbi:MAG: hypothetical protein IKO40_03685 [Kiritimatiellae bacterium]|nr:hypothetical protein [Kiritimatiellia bacterium]